MWPYRIGIEEEYFVSDLRTGNVRRTMSKAFYDACEKELGDVVTPELLQSQIEVRTPPCFTMKEVRDHLTHYRRVLAREAVRRNLAIVASGTHPLAVWPEQKQTPKERYGEVREDLQMLAMRNMVCGLHVHVEVPDRDSRVEIMYRMIPFLPPLLALSASSPFWQGHRTGLLGYRLTAYDELPRTGLPELFRTTAEYRRYIDTLKEAGVIKDSSFIWWAIRPSRAHPTIELRVADSCTHIEDTLAIQCHLDVGVRIQRPHLLILQGYGQEMFAGHTVFFHVEASEHPSHAGEGDAIGIFSLWMRHGGDEIGSAPTGDLAHFLTTHDQHIIVIAGGDRQQSVLDRRGPGGGAVLNGFSGCRQQTQPIHQ